LIQVGPPKYRHFADVKRHILENDPVVFRKYERYELENEKSGSLESAVVKYPVVDQIVAHRKRPAVFPPLSKYGSELLRKIFTMNLFGIDVVNTRSVM